MIKFAYQWEDPLVEEQCYNINHKSLLLIGSGGETLFHLLSKFGDNIEHIECVDININQIGVIKNKLLFMKNNIFINYTGLFDELLYNANKEDDWNKYFNNELLIELFTDNAVKYTSSSFSDHFKNVSLSINKNTYFYNLLNYKIYNPEYFNNIDMILNNIHKVKFHNNNLVDFLKNTYECYDFMSLSNVSDWISNDEFINLINLAENKLNNNGVIVMRRLLSDNIIKPTNNLILKEYNDRTKFYSQCVSLNKLVK